MARITTLACSIIVVMAIAVVGCADDERSIERIDKAWSSVTVGSRHACAVSADGEIRCWGCSSHTWMRSPDACSPPPGRYVDVAAGPYHTCGLREDGEAVCWGRCYSGECLAAPGPFVQLAAGDAHSCGLRADGEVACWGCGVNGWEHSRDPEPCQPPARSFRQIVAFEDHTCGLEDEGSATCWGVGSLVGPQGEGYVQLAASDGYHGCGLRADGSVTCWDIDGTYEPRSSYASIAVGQQFGCGVLQSGGALSCWGEKPDVPPPAGEFIALDAGAAVACAVSIDGRVECWGADQASDLQGPDADEDCL